MAYGQLNTVPAASLAKAPPPPSDQLLQSIEGAVRAANDRLVSVTTRVKGFADYVVGAQPEAVNAAGTAAPVPYGVVHNIGDAVGDLHSLISRLYEQLDRLDRL